MSDFWIALNSLLSQSPSNWVYHVLLLVFLEWNCAYAWQIYRQRPQTANSAPEVPYPTGIFTLATSLALALRLLGGVLAWLALSGIFTYSAVLPPLEIALTLATWLVLLSTAVGWQNRAGLVGLVFACLLAGVATLVVWYPQGSQGARFIGSLFDQLWLLAITSSGVFFLGIAVWRRSAHWQIVFSIGALLAIASAFSLWQLFGIDAATSGQAHGMLRLAEMIALPLYFFLLQRHAPTTAPALPPSDVSLLVVSNPPSKDNQPANFPDLLTNVNFLMAESTRAERVWLLSEKADSFNALVRAGYDRTTHTPLDSVSLEWQKLGSLQAQLQAGLPSGQAVPLPDDGLRQTLGVPAEQNLSAVWIPDLGVFLLSHANALSAQAQTNLAKLTAPLRQMWLDWHYTAQLRTDLTQAQKEVRDSEERSSKGLEQIGLLTSKLQAFQGLETSYQAQIAQANKRAQQLESRLSVLVGSVKDTNKIQRELLDAHQQIQQSQLEKSTQESHYKRELEKVLLEKEDAQAIARQLKQQLDLAQAKKTQTGKSAPAEVTALQAELTKLKQALSDEQERVVELEFLLEAASSATPSAPAGTNLTALTTIRELTEQLLSEKQGLLIGKQKDTLRQIAQQLDVLATGKGVHPPTKPATPALQREWVQMETLIEGAVDEVRGMMREKKLAYTLAIPQALPEISADRVAMQKVLHTLLARACDHTPANGNITVSAQVENSPNHLASLHISVNDTSQVSAVERSAGLTQVQALVAAHGGQLEVFSSNKDRHSVAFWLPITGENAPPR
jgi:signal transduction histidine kinase